MKCSVDRKCFRRPWDFLLTQHKSLVAPPLSRYISKAASVKCMKCPTFHTLFIHLNKCIIRVLGTHSFFAGSFSMNTLYYLLALFILHNEVEEYMSYGTHLKKNRIVYILKLLVRRFFYHLWKESPSSNSSKHVGTCCRPPT